MSIHVLCATSPIYIYIFYHIPNVAVTSRELLVKLTDKDPSKPCAHLTVQISPLITYKGSVLGDHPWMTVQSDEPVGYMRSTWINCVSNIIKLDKLPIMTCIIKFIKGGLSFFHSLP